MVYRLVYGVQAGVWCIGWGMVYRLVYGVQAVVQVGQLRHASFSALSCISSPVHSQRLLPRPFCWALEMNNVSKKYSVEALKQKSYAVSCFLKMLISDSK